MQNYKVLFNLLKITQKINFYFFVFFALIGMFLETLSVGLIIPILSQIINPDLIMKYSSVIYFLELISPINALNKTNLFQLNVNQNNNIIISMFFLFAIFFIFKFFYMFFLEWLKSYYVFSVFKNVGNKLFKVYLSQPLMFHYITSTSDLIANITSEIGIFINNAVYPFVRMVTELIFIFGIFIFLLFYQPLVTLFAFVFIFSTCVTFIYFSKHKINQWSKIRQDADFKRIKAFQQGLGAIEYIKLRSIEDFFYNKFFRENTLVSKVAIKQSLLSSLPLYFLEIVGVFSLLLVAITMTVNSQSVENLIITLGLFTAAAFKIIPSANRVLQAYSFIKYSKPVIDLFYKQLTEMYNTNKTSNSNDPKLKFNNSLIINNLNFSYPESDRKIINEFNLEMTALTSVGIIGESGTGKSTLIKIIMGLIKPDKGQILVDGVSIRANIYDWRNKIGYVSQNTYIIDDSLKKNIAIGLNDEEINLDKLNKIIKLCQLSKFVELLEYKLDTNLGEIGSKISGGEIQRIGIARALYNDPSILILDEPTSALDPKNENNILDLFEKLRGEITILMISHKEQSLRVCDKVIKLN
jgi:ATP-binding cassette, subfamily B, bacterial PglK